MSTQPYDTLAEVYEWLVPDNLLAPEGSVAAFAPLLDALSNSARILDCAAGSGQLAVGLAAAGLNVVATDASPGMIARTRTLATQHGVDLPALVCSWNELPTQELGRFDAVLCVGNSLAHAPGQEARQAALAAMASMLRNRGVLVVTSRNWEKARQQGSGIEVADRVTERHGRTGLVIRAWTMPDSWDQPHYVDVAVALFDHPPAVTTKCERLSLWPFTHKTLEQDLRSAGLAQSTSTYTPTLDRYVITARKTPIRRPRSHQ